jgi:Inorganic Pyrophosphatase
MALKLADAKHKLQGHMSFQGLSIAIENQKGSVRSGVGKDGKKWRTLMKAPYGYIVSSTGADHEGVDVFVGDNKKAENAFVVHQKKDDGSYDEDKVILGVDSVEEAKKLYLSHYDTDKYLGPIRTVPMERLKALVASGKKLTKISSVVLASFFDELFAIEGTT